MTSFNTVQSLACMGWGKQRKFQVRNLDLRTKIKWSIIRLFNNSVSVLNVIWNSNIPGR